MFKYLLKASESRGENAKLGYIMVLLGGILWGTTGTSQALISTGASPLSVGPVRLALGSLFLLLLVIKKDGVIGLRRPWPLGPTIIAAVAMAAFQICFFSAVSKTGVAVGTMVAAGTSPVFAGILGKIFFKENLTFKWGIATLLAAAGCVFLAAGGPNAHLDSTGIVLALLASLCYSSYGLGIKKLGDSHSPSEIMTVLLFLGAVFLSPMFFTQDFSWLWNPNGIVVALHLGILATAVAYFLFACSLSRIPISTAYTLSLSEPLTACLLGVLLLGENLCGMEIGGVILISMALIILTIPKLHKKAAPELTYIVDKEYCRDTAIN